MNRRVIGVLLAAAFVGGGVWLLGRGGYLPGADGALAATAPAWSVGTITDKLDGTTGIEADMEHRTGNGGKVDVAANCNPAAIQFTFEYHARIDANSSLAPGNGYGDIAIRYRLDKGQVRDVLSRTNYKNVATAVFAYEGAQPTPANSEEAIGNATGRLMRALVPAAGAQDLRALLHTSIARFEVPLGDGTSEVIAFSPKEGSFRSFLGACKIDLGRMDADAARTARSAADRQAKERAEEASRREQQAVADYVRQQGDAINTACRNGGQPLRISISMPLGNAEGMGGSDSPQVTAGQIVTTIANDDDRLGRCEVEYQDGGTVQQGFLPTTDLETLDAPPPPPMHIDN